MGGELFCWEGEVSSGPSSLTSMFSQPPPRLSPYPFYSACDI